MRYVALLLLVGLLAPAALAQSTWRAHDMNRTPPRAVTPADTPGGAPADAVVLFDGTDLSAWRSQRGGPAAWTVRDGYFEVKPGAGAIETLQRFGDVQLHIEWAAPDPPQHTSQDRGNSGVFFMNTYEVQVLDSYQHQTYPDGQAGSIYGQNPPHVNASRAPGQWQTYDIIFRRPHFGVSGEVVQPTVLTVLHNGVVVQDGWALWGPTNWLVTSDYAPHADRLPISLQDHGSPVRFRNIWVRPLRETLDPPAPSEAYAYDVLAMDAETLDRYVGQYGGWAVEREGDHLTVHMFGDLYVDLEAVSPTKFMLSRTGGWMTFTLGDDGRPTRMTFTLGGKDMPADRVE